MAPRVAAILLAAGQSRRMGTCKQLLLLEGLTVIARSLEMLLAGGIGELIVVIGPDGDEVARAARDYPVTIVRTSDPHGDMATSVRTGRDALSPATPAAVIALCDYPLVTAATITLLVEAHRLNPHAIIIPCHNGRRGHPPLFPRPLLDTLVAPFTLRDLLLSNPERIECLESGDAGVLVDMDTPGDYRRIVELLKAGHGMS
jgi:molybdenum cofactor cytidylyltransferase